VRSCSELIEDGTSVVSIMDHVGETRAVRNLTVPNLLASVANPLSRMVGPGCPKALDPNHNLVTALCWAERIGLAAPNVNRFLEAKANHPQAWARIEADRHRTGLVVQVPPLPRLYRISRRPLAELAVTALALLSVGAVAVAAGSQLMTCRFVC
jgi:hypothetical protein